MMSIIWNETFLQLKKACLGYLGTMPNFLYLAVLLRSPGTDRQICTGGLTLTAVVSIYMSHPVGLKNWAAVIPITIVPTLCVFTYSFKFSARLLPEIGDVIRTILLILIRMTSFMANQFRRQNLPPS